MIRAFSVAPRPQYQKPAPGKDPAYLAFIRKQPCSVSGCRATFIEAAHTGGRALSRKADDHLSIPLCHWHHQTAPNAYHKGRKQFERTYRLNIPALIRELNNLYASEGREAA